MANLAKQQAVADIMQDLHLNGKCFISFRTDLNPAMRHLVEEQLRLQESIHK